MQTHMRALRIPLGSQVYRVQLDALVRPGTTSLTMQSQPGDPMGNGGTYQFTTANSFIRVTGSPFGISANINGSNQAWGTSMNPPPGDVLTAGTYSGTASYNGLIVEHDGHQCAPFAGSFTIKQAVFSPVDNSLKNYDATFTQYCGTATGALTGELKYDAEPVTTVAGVSRLNAGVNQSGLQITWANPASSRYRYTLVRIEPSGTPAGIAPYAGTSAYGGTGTSSTVHGLVKGHTYTIVAYAVDKYGNVSHPTQRTITY
jgi:hypothetical protein